MTNLEYLEKAKKCDDDINRDINRIANNSYPNNVSWAREIRLTFRQTKALEIIAEALIRSNDIPENIVTALENIDTTLNRRQTT